MPVLHVVCDRLEASGVVLEGYPVESFQVLAFIVRCFAPSSRSCVFGCSGQ